MSANIYRFKTQVELMTVVRHKYRFAADQRLFPETFFGFHYIRSNFS